MNAETDAAADVDPQAQRPVIEVDPETFDRLAEILDRPARRKPRLAALLRDTTTPWRD